MEDEPADPGAPGAPLTPPERRLRVVLRVLSILFALAAPLFLLAAIAIPGEADWAQVGFAVNSATKVAALAGMAAVAAGDLRRFTVLVPLLVIAHAVSVVAIVLVLAFADTGAQFAVLGTHLSLTGVLIGVLVMDGGIGILLALLYLAARRARYRLAYLPPMAFEALAALAEIVVPEGRGKIGTAAVARNVDRYMASFTARRRWIVPAALVGLWLYPIARLHPPFPLLRPESRRALVDRRFPDIGPFARIRFVRQLVRAIVRLAQQMVFLGYYGDERTFDSVGYRPYSRRGRTPVRTPRRTLVSTPSSALPSDGIDADVVVVGTGAGGSVVAHRLALAGHSVVMLEAGRHVDPSEFSEDEVEQISRLYSDGALQQSRDFSFQILQGRCVGGSTTVNNAVCFDLPDRVLADWNARHGAGLDPAALRDSFREVRALMQVARPPSRYLQGGAGRFADGVRTLGLDQPPYRFQVVEANIHDCPGTGYCNIGCPYGSKLSMLDWLLPEAQAQVGTDAFRVIPECTVEHIEHGAGRAHHVVGRLGSRRLRVRADTVVVAGGAIASSWLLRESGIARARAGRRLAFNVGSAITADFDDVLDSFDGVQISHVLEPPAGAGFVVETWFNPVVSQALNMPGWFEHHWDNMHRFRHLTAAGVLVGTQTESAHVRRALTGGPDVDYSPGEGDAASAEDMRRVVEGLKLVGRIFLAAGAKRVMANTLVYDEFRRPEELDRLDRLLANPSELSVGTGHPQGGNAMSTDPRRGVVGPDGRVHGFDNLYVADASVFPGATTVNPQLTVMAVANLAARAIAGR